LCFLYVTKQRSMIFVSYQDRLVYISCTLENTGACVFVLVHYNSLRNRFVDQPLIPLRLTPAMMYFLRKMNTRNRGRDTRATAAICTG